MPARGYNLKDVDFVFGVIIADGYQDGDSIAIEYDNDAFNYTPNGDGGGTRSATNDNSATVTLTLSASSPTNDLLSAQAELDRLSGGGVNTLLIKDNNGTSLFATDTCWIQKKPGSTFGKEVGTREWTFRTDDLISNIGSNSEL